jgi:hypothetical protein
MPETLEEDVWTILLQRIQTRLCTPFLGAGAAAGVLPLGRGLAKEWAEKYGYPLMDKDDLIRVSQFVSVRFDRQFPKLEIQRRFRGLGSPDFSRPDEPHAFLASLRLPLYITTNYDHFMMQALEASRQPRQVVCPWNEALQKQKPLAEREIEFEDHRPVVFHLHGEIDHPESLVLTEDDYLDFVANLSRNEEIIPLRIRERLAATSLLFIGYGLNDWNFRVLFRSIGSYMGRSLSPDHISVQLEPTKAEATAQEKAQVRKYLDKYFSKLNVNVYWGTSQEFVTELRQRLEAAS